MKTNRITRGFTLIEMLVVFTIITVLIGLLLPALNAVSNHSKESQAAIEIAQLEAALKEYKSIWQEYPPDRLDSEGWGSGRCLVFYLGTEFRAGRAQNTAPWGEDISIVSTRSFGPLYSFPADRLVDGGFLDPFGHPEEEPDSYYRYDNNVRDDGADPDGSQGATNWNVSNLNYDGVDIWSWGLDLGEPEADRFEDINQDAFSADGGTEEYFTQRDTLLQTLDNSSDDIYNY